MRLNQETITALDDRGFAVIEPVIDAATVSATATTLGAVRSGVGVRWRGGVYAIRNLLDLVPAVDALVHSPVVRSLVAPILGPDYFIVRGLLFDKTPGANWGVAWHQDLSIAVRARKAVPGFGPWSVKAGVLHVRPPVPILERMLTVRLHLDAVADDQGPLHVIPGSHRYGRLDAEAVRRWRAEVPAVSCLTARGGALLMRPLLLHASSPARVPGHRRVLHLEFAAEPLPAGLEWYGTRTREPGMP